MSQEQSVIAVPNWDLADRMRKALREANVGVQEMADYLEVTRLTVGRWINGRVDPSPQTIRLWALHTGVPYEWLRYGTDPPNDGTPPLTKWSAVLPIAA